MTVRLPSNLSSARADPNAMAFDLLTHELLAEKASALGRTGRMVEEALASLRALDKGSPQRPARLRIAADAVYAYFIQRELCGFRRHQDVIREYGIPNEVLVRLGAK
jgi:hypothetical protein